jgi:exodeoxyribonuclease-3
MDMLKIATWNVNSLRVRLPQVLDWLSSAKPDVFALQETKLIDDDFPLQEINQAGYQVVFSGQKTYNGVAILSRHEITNPIKAFPGFDDVQRRVLAVTTNDVRVINLYIPNGESVGSEKYQYKMGWLQQLKLFLQHELKQHKNIVILGDFNIAPEEIDVHDPKLWEGKVLFSELERNAFQDILQLGFKDCFRLHPQPEKSFTWWDYRMNAYKRKMGLRIDHILASETFASQCTQCYIDKNPREHERPSDHTVVIAEFV